MNKNDLFSLSFILIVVVAILAVSPDVAHNNIVAYATLENDNIVMEEHSSIQFNIGEIDYVLRLYKVASDRRSVNFKLFSYPLSDPVAYQNYFKMDLRSHLTSYFNDPSPVVVHPNKYQIFELGEGTLNIELVSIGSNKATIKVDIT